MKAKEKIIRVYSLDQANETKDKYLSPYEFISAIRNFTWEEHQQKVKVTIRIVDRYDLLLYTVYGIEEFVQS